MCQIKCHCGITKKRLRKNRVIGNWSSQPSQPSQPYLFPGVGSIFSCMNKTNDLAITVVSVSKLHEKQVVRVVSGGCENIVRLVKLVVSSAVVVVCGPDQKIERRLRKSERQGKRGPGAKNMIHESATCNTERVT